jgi:phage terminase large subunit-like protein
LKALKYPPYKRDYAFTLEQASRLSKLEERNLYARLCLSDMYFLLHYGCGVPSYAIDQPFPVWRCNRYDEDRDSEQGMDRRAYFIFRGGFKSLVFNYGGNIQSILAHPEDGGCILSYNNPAAKTFFKPIKATLEDSETLKSWFPDVLYKNPKKESSLWTQDEGIIVKRNTNRQEPTLMAAGLVDSLPTRMHFNRRVFDDIVTRENTRTRHSMDEIIAQWQLADNIDASTVPGARNEHWILGTFYRFNDPYAYFIQQKIYTTEIVPCRDEDGVTHLISEEVLKEKLALQGRYAFNTQMNLNPVPDAERRFDVDKIETYDRNMRHKFERYILLVDPAGTKKSARNHDPDYTVAWVIGYDRVGNAYIVDGFYDRQKSTDVAERIFELILKWNIKWVSWEKVGHQSDIQWLSLMMNQNGFSFHIHEYAPQKYGPKEDRIEDALLARFERGVLKVPEKLPFVQHGGKVVDLIEELMMELKQFPFSSHDDMSDALAQIGAAPAYGRSGKARVIDDKSGNARQIMQDSKSTRSQPVSVEGVTSYM